MNLRYREDKTTQAAALLLKLGGGKSNLLKVINLLYFADRRALLNGGRPITFDEYWCTRKGPVLTATLDLAKRETLPNTETNWSKHITLRNVHHEVALVAADVPRNQLSYADESLIADIYEQFGHLDQAQLRDYAHKHFPECKNPGGSSYRISIRDILLAEGLSAIDADGIEHDLRGEQMLLALRGS